MALAIGSPRDSTMETIGPATSLNSTNSPLKSQSRESSNTKAEERGGGINIGAGDGYASDSESDFDQPQTEEISSGASSPEQRKYQHVPHKGSPSTRRGGRSAHSVSFSRKQSRLSEKRIRYDGEEVTMVTLDTQTDWDWFEDAEISGRVKIIHPSEDASLASPRVSAGAKVKSILVKPESRENTSRPRTELVVSSTGNSRAETDYTPFSLQPNDEFGIPLLEMSSTSDDSSDDEAVKKKKPPPRVSLPSVGPPQILKYVRESELPNLVPDFKESAQAATLQMENIGDLPVDEDGNPLGMFNGPCEFCNRPILPIPTLEMQQMKGPSDLYCCEDYREFIQFATSTALRMEQEAQKATKLISIKPHGHHGSKQDRRVAKERAVERMRQRELARRQQEASGSRANFYTSAGGSAETPASGAQHAQKSVKPGAGTATAGGVGGAFKDLATPAGLRGPAGGVGAGPAHGFHSHQDGARQMKTINYQLSSQRCLEEGWTLRPPSPLDPDDNDIEIFVPEPLHPAAIASGNVRDRQLIQKFYPGGEKFLTIFPDGTGNVFYPSGHLSILISSISLGQYTYIVLDNSPEQAILAVFGPQGFGTTYYLNGNIKLYYDQVGGIELDVFGAKKKRWHWKDQEVHVHAPPFQPICMQLNRHNSVRVMAQESISLTFMASKRSCHFSVGARLKLVAPQLLPRGKEIDQHQLFIDERTACVENILNKVALLLKFPKSPKVDKILPPLHVISKMQRNERMRKELSASSIPGNAKGKEAKGQNLFPPVRVSVS